MDMFIFSIILFGLPAAILICLVIVAEMGER